MIPVRAIRCVHCPRPVHPTRGGAYCAEHTPLDLTGGVSPSDSSGRRPVLPLSGGAKTGGRPRTTSEELIAEWVALYEAGVSTHALELRYGTSSGQVRYHLKRAGVTIRTLGAAAGARA